MFDGLLVGYCFVLLDLVLMVGVLELFVWPLYCLFLFGSLDLVFGCLVWRVTSGFGSCALCDVCLCIDLGYVWVGFDCIDFVGIV